MFSHLHRQQEEPEEERRRPVRLPRRHRHELDPVLARRREPQQLHALDGALERRGRVLAAERKVDVVEERAARGELAVGRDGELARERGRHVLAKQLHACVERGRAQVHSARH